jgi:hypothetical protein
MGTLFVDKLDPQSGTSLEIGSSGDTITIPSGATITNNGTQTGFGQNNTPYFLAKMSGDQTASDGAFAKIVFNNEVLDSAGAYDPSTNYRWTPQTAGKYFIYTSQTLYKSGTDLNDTRAYIYKNGSIEIQGSISQVSDQISYVINYVGGIVQMNGSSDYVESYGYVSTNSGASAQFSSGNGSFWGGYFIAT